MNEHERILELAGVAKGPTIASASTAKNDGINRKTANRMVDPKGYFQKNACDSILNAKDSAEKLGYPVTMELSEIMNRLHQIMNESVPGFDG